jgi:hypothetical protein
VKLRRDPLAAAAAAPASDFDPAAIDCLGAHRDDFSVLVTGEALATFERDVAGFAFAEDLARLDPVARARGLLPA